MATSTTNERLLGRIEGILESISADVADAKSDGKERDTKIDNMSLRLTEVERILRDMAGLPKNVSDLQQVIRDGRMMTRGAMVGLMTAGGVLGTAGSKAVAAIYAAFTGG